MKVPNRWRPALRIARRDALRARGRSALVVVMIALPVLTMTAVDVLTRSAQLDPQEKVTRTLGRAEAKIDLSGGRVLQAPDPDDGWASEGSAPEGDPTAALRAALPTGARLLAARTGGVETETEAGVGTADWNEVRVGSPVFTGRFRRVDGRAPRTADEVAVTSRLLDHLGVAVGDEVTLTDPARTMTVTGVFDQTGSPGYETFWARPGTLIGPGLVESGAPSYYVLGVPAISWHQVLALNAVGALVSSREVLLHPPADAAVPFLEQAHQGGFGSAYVLLILLVSVVVVLSTLEVTLLAGAAFAVGARRSARSLGLVAASGGSQADVRRIVLAGGVVLGTVGALLGTSVGLVVAAVARPLLVRLADADFGHFDVRPLELLAIALVGLVTGVLAAVLPARTASRQDPVVALTGRRGQVRTPKKVPAIGLAITALGIGAASLGSVLALALTTGVNPMNSTRTALVAGLIAGGAALAQIGLIVTSPAVVGLAGRLSGPLPLTARLALRDAARHRGRSAPAMAAVLTAVTGSTALLLYVTSMDAHDRESYQPELAAGHGRVELFDDQYHPASQTWTHQQLDAGRVETAVRGSVPRFTSTVVNATDENCFDEFCGYVNVRNDAMYIGGSGGFAGTPVGGAALVRELVGRSSADAARALAAGGVVVTAPGAVRDGTLTFDVVTAAASEKSATDGTEATPTRVTLPAAYVRSTADAAPALVYSPAAAAALSLDVRPAALLLDFSRLPTQDEQERASAAVVASGAPTGSLFVERGYTSNYGLGLLALIGGAGIITLGAAGIATGLAQADARADHATLAAIGAAPRVRRSLAAAQALTVALLGTGLGIAAGFVPALALIGAMDSLDVVVPWGRLLVVLVGIPLLAGGLAWLFVRSRLPLERRVA